MRWLGMLCGFVLWGGITLTLFLHSSPRPKLLDFLGIPAFFWNADERFLKPLWPVPLIIWQVLAFGGAGALLALTYVLLHNGHPMLLRRIGRNAALWLVFWTAVSLSYFGSGFLRLELTERYWRTALFYSAAGLLLGAIGIISLYMLRKPTGQEIHSFFSSQTAREIAGGAAGLLFFSIVATILYMHAVPKTLLSFRFPGMLFGPDAFTHKPWELFLYDLFLFVILIGLLGISLSLFLIRRIGWRLIGGISGIFVFLGAITAMGTIVLNRNNFALFAEGLYVFLGLLFVTGVLSLLSLRFLVLYRDTEDTH